MSENVLDFSNLTIIEIPVHFPTKKYILREASGESAALFRNESLRCARFNAEGKVAGMEGLGHLESLLVHYCLLDKEEKRVPLEIIRAWPSRIVRQLFDKAKAISGLNEDSSLAELRKQRAELDQKIMVMESEAEDPSKNS